MSTRSLDAAWYAAVKLAITGGTGFVGSHLLDAAIAAGHEGQSAHPPASSRRVTASTGSKALSTIATP